MFLGRSVTSLLCLGSFISTEQRIMYKSMLKSLRNRQKAQAALMPVHLSLWNGRVQMPMLKSLFTQIVTLKQLYPFTASPCTCSSPLNKKTGTMAEMLRISNYRPETAFCLVWPSCSIHYVPSELHFVIVAFWLWLAPQNTGNKKKGVLATIPWGALAKRHSFFGPHMFPNSQPCLLLYLV